MDGCVFLGYSISHKGQVCLCVDSRDYFLGIEVQHLHDGSLLLFQSKYIQDLLVEAKMTGKRHLYPYGGQQQTVLFWVQLCWKTQLYTGP